MNTPPGSTSVSLSIPDHNQKHSFADHESSLWRAAITQALMDAGSRSRKTEAVRHRQEALEWLLGLTQDFEIVCENAGMDPDYIRTQARAALTRGFLWRLPAGQGWRTKARLESSQDTITKH